jgi:glutaredoxin 2
MPDHTFVIRPKYVRDAFIVSPRQINAYRPPMPKGIEKMERSASYIVRLQKNGEYAVVMSRPEWANREIPGFATEAAANAWIAGRRRQSRL